MPSFRHFYMIVIILCCGPVSASGAGQQAASSGGSAAVMKSCPDSPNCVSSEAQDQKHHIAPLIFSLPAAEAWKLLQEQVAKLPRTIVVTDKPGYLHAECRSALFGFVDDLEFYLRAEQGQIALRSAARTGYYDFGVNRRRVEGLREVLRRESEARGTQ